MTCALGLLGSALILAEKVPRQVRSEGTPALGSSMDWAWEDLGLPLFCCFISR